MDVEPPTVPIEPDPEPPSFTAKHGSHTVTLVSAGWNQAGGQFMQQWMPGVDFKNCGTV